MKVLALDTATTDLVTGIVDTDTGESIDRVITCLLYTSDAADE